MALSEARLAFLRDDFVQGFTAYCGLEALEIDEGRLVSRVRIQPQHRQQDGFIHAGLMATLADHSAGYAAYTLVPDDHRILTVEFKVNFLRPASGDELICRAQVIRPGRKLLVCESAVFDRSPEGKVEVTRLLATMAAVQQDRLARAGEG